MMRGTAYAALLAQPNEPTLSHIGSRVTQPARPEQAWRTFWPRLAERWRDYWEADIFGETLIARVRERWEQ